MVVPRGIRGSCSCSGGHVCKLLPERLAAWNLQADGIEARGRRSTGICSGAIVIRVGRLAAWQFSGLTGGVDGAKRCGCVGRAGGPGRREGNGICNDINRVGEGAEATGGVDVVSAVGFGRA